MNRNIRLIVLSILILVVTSAFYGCSTTAATGTDQTTKETAAATDKTSNESVNKNMPKELVIVLLPGEDSPEVLDVKNNFDKEMSKAIGIPVKEYHATDYNAAIEAMRTGKAHVARLGPFSYVHAVDRAGAECFAVTGKDGVASYQSWIVTQADSDIKTLADLKGKTFSFVDPESTSGNVVPSNEILNAVKDPNLTFDDLHINGKFFESVMFAGTHPNSLQGIFKGDVDAGAVSSSTYASEIKKGNVDEAKLRVIHKSPDLPSSPWSYQKDLPQELKDKIKNFVLNFDDETYWTTAGGKKVGDKTVYRFIEIKDSEYAYIRELRDKFDLKD